MKTKTLVACAFAAAALPSTPSWATQPTGPQGTQLYGQRQLSFADVDLNGDGVITPDEYRAAERRAPVRGAYNGFSADTNPPAPAP